MRFRDCAFAILGALFLALSLFLFWKGLTIFWILSLILALFLLWTGYWSWQKRLKLLELLNSIRVDGFFHSVYESASQSSVPPDFRRALKLARQLQGLTIEKAAEELDVDTSTLSRWEQGKQIPQARHLVRLCTLYGVAPEQMNIKSSRRGPRRPKNPKD